MKPWATPHRLRLLVGAAASALVWAAWPGLLERRATLSLESNFDAVEVSFTCRSEVRLAGAFTGLAAAEPDDTPAAQEAETKDASGDADPKDAPSGDESTDAEADTEESGADESVEVFVPSEQISEDIDVPFPVDI